MRLRDLFRFWLPLFGSWILLTAEGPLVSTVISRLPQPAIMLAAQGIMVGVSVLIESPIINILSTSTAKVKDYATYALVRRFNIHLLIGLTILTLLVGYTPLFDLVVIRLMGTPPDIAEYVRIGLRINILWSAAIGWRRFLQGVLIKFDRTQAVAVGTGVRLAVSILTAVSLATLTDVSGAVVGAWTLQIGVVCEAIYATWAVRPLFEKELLPNGNPADLTYIELFWFHLPLASTAVLMLLVQPLAVFTLARLAEPKLSLAAWPVLFQVLLLARAPALATPEVIIARNNSAENRVVIRRFITLLAAAVLISMALFVYTPLQDFYFDTLLKVPTDIGRLARNGLRLSILFPAITLVIMSIRGFLISNQRTGPVNVGMSINLALSAAVLLIGIPLEWGGIFTGAVAINLAAFAELGYLLTQVRSTNMLT
ncbi:MAG: hypothetical protein ACPG8W_17000 [Candidatus Promineifilaceae bacterium]